MTATCSTPGRTARSASASSSASAARRARPSRSSAPVTSARWPSSRRRGRATGWPTATSRSRCPRASCRRRGGGAGRPAREEPITMPAVKLPAPVMAFAIEPRNKGDEEKVFSALRRLQEEDPTIDLHRDPQTAEEIVAGLSQMHVEVIVDRLKSRFGVEVSLKPPRVPYQESIRRPAKAHGRHKKQTGGRGQFGDCHISIEPHPDGESFEFVDAIKGGVIPHGFIPAVQKGVLEAMANGP